MPAGVGSLNSISCLSISTCVAGGTNPTSSGAIILSTSNQGTNWTSDAIPADTFVSPQTVTIINTVSCTGSTCVAAGNDGTDGVILYSANQTSWTPENVGPTASLTAVSCNGSFCVTGEGGGYVISYSTNSGVSWMIKYLSSSFEIMPGLYCYSSSTCLVSVDSTNANYANEILNVSISSSGISQVVASMTPTSNGFTDIHCVTVLWCIMVGQSNPSATILITTDGGKTWNKSTTPPALYQVFSVGCANTADCVIFGMTSSVASMEIYTTDGGTTWSTGSLPNSAFIFGVDCVSSSQCVGAGYVNGQAGGEVLVSNNGGQSWLLGTLPSGSSQLTSVSCNSTSNCVVSGNGQVYYSTNGGSSWTLSNLNLSNSVFYTISCDATVDCVVAGVGTSNTAISYYSSNSGQTWIASTLPSGAYLEIFSISCSGSTCYALGNGSSNQVFEFFGTTNYGVSWTLLSPPANVQDLYQLTCPSNLFCMAASYVGSSTLEPLDYIISPTISSVSLNKGPSTGGTQVVISGSGFLPSDSVYFGSTLGSSIVFVSSTQLDAVSPQGSGTVDITANLDGVSSAVSSVDRFTYLNYEPVNPTRICDTRTANGTGVISNQCDNGSLGNSGPLAAGQIINVNVTGTFGSTIIPSNANSVVLNITVTNTTAPGGFLTAWPTGQSQPNTSILNFGSNENVPNLVQIGVGTNGDVSIYNYNGSTDVIVDIEGYTAPSASVSTVGQFVPISPVRICDTRAASGTSVISNQCDNGSLGNNGPLGAGQIISLNVSGSGSGGSLDGIPSNATSVVLNVTATNTTAYGGFLTVYPSNLASPPNASNLNFGPGISVANRVVVPIDTANGNISVYSYNGSTDVIVDVNGYFTGGNSLVTGDIFNPIVPVRICDTRAASGTSVISNQCDNGSLGNTGELNPTEIVSVAASNIYSIPANASAVVLNVTVTNTTSNGGFLTIYPASTSQVPNISDLNWSQTETIANMSVVKIGINDSIDVYNAVGQTDLIVDVMGYYTS